MPRPRPLALLAAAALAAVAAGGCANATTGDDPVKLTVTDAFGARVVLERTADEVPASETAMRLVQRNAEVSTRYGGGFVQCVERPCAAVRRPGGARTGSTSSTASRRRRARPPRACAPAITSGGTGGVWDAAERVPAVVGSFPEPFLHGPGEKRLPVRVECLRPQDAVCRDAQQALVDFGISASKTTLRSSIAAGHAARGRRDVGRPARGRRAAAARGRPGGQRRLRRAARRRPQHRPAGPARADRAHAGGRAAASSPRRASVRSSPSGRSPARTPPASPRPSGRSPSARCATAFAVAVDGDAAVALPVQEGAR